MTPLRMILPLALMGGPVPAPVEQEPAPQPVLIQPQGPGRPSPTQPAQPQDEPERVEGRVLDPDNDAGIKPPRTSSPSVAKASKARGRAARTMKKVKKKVNPPPPPPKVEVPADHDDRANHLNWLNSNTQFLPTNPAMRHLTPQSVVEWSLSVPALIPGPDGAFSPTQQAIMASIQRKPVEVHGFVRAYRRLTLPSGTVAAFWIGPSQASPLSDCIIAKVPAVRLPNIVSEFILRVAANQGWPIKVQGWPSYLLQTKYRVGIDRAIPWEVDGVERCEIQTPLTGAPPEAGPAGTFRKLTVDGD